MAGAGTQLRGPAQPHAPAPAPEPEPEPPRGVKEAGRRVRCAAFYLMWCCLYGGCDPSAY